MMMMEAEIIQALVIIPQLIINHLLTILLLFYQGLYILHQLLAIQEIQVIQMIQETQVMGITRLIHQILGILDMMIQVTVAEIQGVIQVEVRTKDQYL
jgi:hypothetical protein